MTCCNFFSTIFCHPRHDQLNGSIIRRGETGWFLVIVLSPSHQKVSCKGCVSHHIIAWPCHLRKMKWGDFDGEDKASAFKAMQHFTKCGIVQPEENHEDAKSHRSFQPSRPPWSHERGSLPVWKSKHYRNESLIAGSHKVTIREAESSAVIELHICTMVDPFVLSNLSEVMIFLMKLY